MRQGMASRVAALQRNNLLLFPTLEYKIHTLEWQSESFSQWIFGNRKQLFVRIVAISACPELDFKFVTLMIQIISDPCRRVVCC